MRENYGYPDQSAKMWERKHKSLLGLPGGEPDVGGWDHPNAIWTRRDWSHAIQHAAAEPHKFIPRQPHPVQSGPIKKAHVFSSPNTGELNFPQALTASQSSGQAGFRHIALDLLGKLGIRQHQVEDAIGDWSDGAENSVAARLDEPVDPSKVQYLAAWMGLLGHQKSVLAFIPGEGPDTLHELQTSQTDLSFLRRRLSEIGIPFRTLVPHHKEGTTIYVWDQGNKLSPNVHAAKDTFGGQISSIPGTGTLIGEDPSQTRSASRANYRSIISDFEGAGGLGNNPAGSAGQPQPAGNQPAQPSGPAQSQSPATVVRGVGYPPGQFLPKPF
jgi:hypothetical protein